MPKTEVLITEGFGIQKGQIYDPRYMFGTVISIHCIKWGICGYSQSTWVKNSTIFSHLLCEFEQKKLRYSPRLHFFHI